MYRSLPTDVLLTSLTSPHRLPCWLALLVGVPQGADGMREGLEKELKEHRQQVAANYYATKPWFKEMMTVRCRHSGWLLGIIWHRILRQGSGTAHTGTHGWGGIVWVKE